MSLPWANTKADVLAVRKTVRRRSYHQFIGEGDAVNYLARQRDNGYAVTGNPDVPIRFHRIRRGRVVRRRRQSPGGGVALLADPRRRPSRSSTPDHTEPIHLVNQRRRMWIMAGLNRKWLRECTVPIGISYRQAAQS